MKGVRQPRAAPSAPRPRAARTWPGRRPRCCRNARSHACSCARTSRSRSMARESRGLRAPRISRREGGRSAGAANPRGPGGAANRGGLRHRGARPRWAGRGARRGEAGLSAVEAAAGPVSAGRLLTTERGGVHSRPCSSTRGGRVSPGGEAVGQGPTRIPAPGRAASGLGGDAPGGGGRRVERLPQGREEPCRGLRETPGAAERREGAVATARRLLPR